MIDALTLGASIVTALLATGFFIKIGANSADVFWHKLIDRLK